MRDTDLLRAMIVHAPTVADLVSASHPAGAFQEVVADLYGSEPDPKVALDKDCRSLVAQRFIVIYNAGPLPDDVAIRVTQAGRDHAELIRWAVESVDPCPRGDLP